MQIASHMSRIERRFESVSCRRWIFYQLNCCFHVSILPQRFQQWEHYLRCAKHPSGASLVFSSLEFSSPPYGRRSPESWGEIDVDVRSILLLILSRAGSLVPSSVTRSATRISYVRVAEAVRSRYQPFEAQQASGRFPASVKLVTKRISMPFNIVRLTSSCLLSRE